jgi:dolichyl-diphosphooligosaccharide--protein glycosyltransferase
MSIRPAARQEASHGSYTLTPGGDAAMKSASKATAAAAQSLTRRGRLLRLARVVLLALICALAFVIRLFAVVRFESIIHEFDPHFNFRATVLLAERGPGELWNWFDGSSWYPLGRDVGSTVYPALPLTAGLCWWLSRALGVPVSLRACAVFLPPLCSAITCIATYGLTLQVVRRGAHGAGLFAAAFVAVVPSYLSRSCAGAYDNESVAIPALVVTFALYLKALNTSGGAVLWAALSAVAYGYMVMAWGGHVFVVNLIAVHCVVLVLLCGRFSRRLYVAYSVWYALGGLLAVQTPFVRGKVMGGSSEYLAAHCAFTLVQVRAASPALGSALRKLGVRPAGALAIGSCLLMLLVAVRLASANEWADGRLRRLLDPTRAAASIVASVAEHQPARWSSLFKDLHVLQFLIPPGLILLAHGDANEHSVGRGSDESNDYDNRQQQQQQRVSESVSGAGSDARVRVRAPSDAKIFAVLFGCFALYFNGIMERCSLIFAPAACVVSGVAASRAVSIYAGKALACRRPRVLSDRDGAERPPSSAAEAKAAAVGTDDGCREQRWWRWRWCLRRRWLFLGVTIWLACSIVMVALLSLTCLFVQHAVWMAAVEFSSPAVVFEKGTHPSAQAHSTLPRSTMMGADTGHSSRSAFTSTSAYTYVDDFREAYSWLRFNTAEDAKVLAWWDYGYQLSALANRSTFVDNNTWNSTAIAAVGRVLAASEAEGARLMREMGAEYVMIVFGGVVGWPEDDIGKMLWPVRIASGVFPETVQESDYLTGGLGGQLRMDSAATPAVKQSLLVRCAYYRFDEYSRDDDGHGCGYDRARMTRGPFSSPGAAKMNEKKKEKLREGTRQQTELRGQLPPGLEYFEEVYSTRNWVVRIFALKPEPQRRS